MDATSSDSEAPCIVMKSKDNDFYMTLVTFEVQNILFRMPAEAFESQSEVFRDMFSLPQAVCAGEVAEGRSDDSPIVLEGVEAEDFKALLRFLVPKKFCTSIDISQKEWISIHHLACMWGFEDAKLASKDFLVNMDDSITKFELATQYDYDDWLRRAYKELAYRPTPLSMDEAKRMGFEPSFHVAHLRDVRLEAQVRFQVVEKSTRSYSGTTRRNHAHAGGRSFQCPHCAGSLELHGFIKSDKEAAEKKATHRCEPCGVTYYEKQKHVNFKVARAVEEEIESIVPRRENSDDASIGTPLSTSSEYTEILASEVTPDPQPQGVQVQAEFGGWGNPGEWGFGD